MAMIAGKIEVAMRHYRSAITLNPCNPFAWVGVGEAMLEVGSPIPAAQALRVATALQPGHYTAWLDLGRAEEAVGHRAEAAEAYREALVAKPDFAPAMDGLARTR